MSHFLPFYSAGNPKAKKKDLLAVGCATAAAAKRRMAARQNMVAAASGTSGSAGQNVCEKLLGTLYMVPVTSGMARATKCRVCRDE